MPGAKVVGVLIDPNFQESEAQTQEVRSAASTIGQHIRISNARNDEELESAFKMFVQEKIDTLLVCADPFFDTRRDLIIGFTAQHRIPAIYQNREYAVRGGLMSYGVNFPEGYRQVGVYTGKISREKQNRRICQLFNR